MNIPKEWRQILTETEIAYWLKVGSQAELNNHSGNRFLSKLMSYEGITIDEKIEKARRDQSTSIFFGSHSIAQLKSDKLDDAVQDSINYHILQFDEFDEGERNYIKENIEIYNGTFGDGYEILYIKQVADTQYYLFYMEIKKERYLYFYNLYSIKIGQYSCSMD